MEHNDSRSSSSCGVAAIKDPKREWELAPFREALEKFVQSAEEIIAKRPPCQLSVNLQHIGQPITPMLKSSEHSTHFLQLYEANKALKTEEKNENKCRCPPPAGNSMNEVQTQTIPTKADGDVCSRKHSGGDDYDEESFLSYDSKCNSIVQFLSPPQNDEDPPPHDGACPSSQNEQGNLAAEISLGACAIAAELDVPPPQFLHQNQKGCAWVFDLNEKAACADTSTGSGNQSNQSGVKDSDDSEEYNSSFISDDV